MNSKKRNILFYLQSRFIYFTSIIIVPVVALSCGYNGPRLTVQDLKAALDDRWAHDGHRQIAACLGDKLLSHGLGECVGVVPAELP